MRHTLRQQGETMTRYVRLEAFERFVTIALARSNPGRTREEVVEAGKSVLAHLGMGIEGKPIPNKNNWGKLEIGTKDA